MCQRTHTPKSRFKIGEDSRFILTQRDTICSIALARAWLSINPAFAESACCKIGEPGRIGIELLNDEPGCFIKFPYPIACSNRSKQAVPGESCQPKYACFSLQVAPKIRERCTCSRKHSIKRLSINTVGKERCIQWRLPVPPLRNDKHLALNTIKCRSQGECNAFPTSQFSFIGPVTYRAIRIIGHITYHAHRRSKALPPNLYWYVELRCNVTVQSGPRCPTAYIQFGCKRLFGLWH